ncbi:MAG: hypothetical protein IJL76_03670 [Bacilli bacterium]|nr:hypothetical protein [Bacilli bacterium]
MDKLKNALFEEVEEEVDDTKPIPVKPKKEKEKVVKKTESVKDKIKKKKEREKLESEKALVDDRVDHHVLKDEDFEIKPKLERRNDDEDMVLDKPISVEGNTFKVIEDKDLIVDDSFDDTAQIVDIIDETNTDDTYSYYEEEAPKKMEDKEVREAYQKAESHNNLYGMNNSTIKMHEYGSMSKKEEKTIFKPSPIISPVYGVLDKNYKKEDVVSKADTPFRSSYERTNMSVDDVRKKAYGTLSDDLIDDMDKELENTMPIPKIDEDYNEDTVVDLSAEEAKPEVKTVTMGDAEEYFNDLGLEYNVDYKDASNSKQEEKKEEEPKHASEEEKFEVKEEPKEENKEVKEKLDEEKVEVKEEPEVKKEKSDEENDDNLFDLIDSMYQESE